MPDYNSEASNVWDALKPAIDGEIDQRTRGMVQRRKAKVTTAPSLVTNKIGVTEPYGTEIFIPFVSNLASAVVGDYVWVEFMYGANNSFASMFASADSKDQTVAGNLTVGGVLDVTQRRCYASLSSAGWYRVFNVTGGLGRAGSSFTITLNIGRSYNYTNNELHTVTLLANYNNQEFSSEVSKSNSLGITKVRYTADGSYNGHIDIYYNLTAANLVYVNFDVHCRPENAYLIQCNAVTPTAVAPSPSGETVLTEYSFAANTEANGSVTAGSGVTINEMDIKRSGRIVYVHFYATGTFAANTSYTLGTLSGVPLPTNHIRWMTGGGEFAYNATTPVYAILDYSNSQIKAYASAACKAINITVSYIV